MHSVSNLAKRLFAAGSLMLLAACGSNGPTDPTAPAVSPVIRRPAATAPVTTSPSPTTTTVTPAPTSAPTPPPNGGFTTQSGYNVTAF
jgi:hypothetical protein